MPPGVKGLDKAAYHLCKVIGANADFNYHHCQDVEMAKKQAPAKKHSQKPRPPKAQAKGRPAVKDTRETLAERAARLI